MSETYLPLIVVSASDLASASKFISEIIDNEVSESDKRLRKGRVWRITNKYYRVDVEVCLALDAQPLPAALQHLEAHVIYVADGEFAEKAEARRAALDAAPGAGSAEVQLLVSASECMDDALCTWARLRGYEAVPLYERRCDADAEGAERVRAALHAHPWRGLTRLDRASHNVGAINAEEELDEEAAVERAEAFAAALAEVAGAGGEAGSDAERRRRAERVLAALCRALGDELPAL